MPRKSLQGVQAVMSGQDMRAEVQSILRHFGYGQCPIDAQQRQLPCFMPEYTGALTNLYGKPMKVNYFLWHPTKFPQGFVIHLKFQAWQGSACEQLPYKVLSLKHCGLPALYLLSGGGFKPQALLWAEAQQEPGRFWVRHSEQGYLLPLLREFL